MNEMLQGKFSVKEYSSICNYNVPIHEHNITLQDVFCQWEFSK